MKPKFHQMNKAEAYNYVLQELQLESQGEKLLNMLWDYFDSSDARIFALHVYNETR